MKPHLAEVRPGRLEGTVRAPPSKSETHRAFVLAAQSDTPCTVQAPLLGEDTRATLACLLALGARVHLDDRAEGVHAVQFLPAPWRAPSQALDCRNSGTTLRLLTAAAARLGQPVLLTGDASLRARPNGPLLHALRALGATVEDDHGRAPLAVRGPLRAGAVALDSAVSSQFASALLLALPQRPGPSRLRLEGDPVSRPYLDVTLSAAQRFGLRIERDGTTFTMPGGDVPRAGHVAVGGDWSAAAMLLCAAAATGGDVTVTGLDPASPQGDRAILRHLGAYGVRVSSAGDAVRVQADGPLQAPGEIDLRDAPDLFPPLAALASLARGTTRLTGAAHLRHKESDRISAMAAGLNALGAQVIPAPDGATIRGGAPLRGGSLASHGDHRVHMALCIAALAAQGLSAIDGPASAAVSHPGFHADLAALGADVRLLQGNRAQVAA